MCGRVMCALDPVLVQQLCTYQLPDGAEVKPEWKEAPTGETYKPMYNAAPTIFTPVLLSGVHYKNEKCHRVLQPMRWGMIPSWHKGERSAFKTMHNNCRSETLMEKSTFSAPMNKGRRFYEWKTTGKVKQPYLFTPKGSEVKTEVKNELKDEVKNESLLYMAGVFDIFQDMAGPLYSYSILTTESTGAAAQVHHRMPVILQDEEEVEKWLNYKDYPIKELKGLIKPKDCLQSHRVTDKVNNVRYNEPDCCLQLADKPASNVMSKGDLRNWFTTKPNKRKSTDDGEIIPKRIKNEESEVKPDIKTEHT